MTGGIGLIGIGQRRGRRLVYTYVFIYAACCTGTATGAELPRAAGETGPPPPLEALEPPTTKPWTFSATGATDLTFTDNVLLTATNRQSDFIFSPRATFDLHGQSRRAAVNASADIAYDFYANTSRLNGARPRALIDGNIDIVEQTFSVDGRIATDLQQISQEGRAPGTQRSFGENQVQILNYGVTPRFQQRVGDFAKAEVTYDFSGVNFLDPPVGGAAIVASDTTRHSAQATLSSLASANLDWSVLGAYEHSDSNGLGFSSDRARGEGRVQYHTSTTFAVIGRGGYDWIDEPTLASSPDGGYALGGFLWRPSQRTSVRAEAGYRYQGFNAVVEATYRRSQVLNFSLTYTRDVQTTQRLLTDNLGNLTRDELGNLIDPLTGLPPNPNSQFFDLTNQAFKRDLFQLGVNGTFGRNFYNVGGSYERRHANGLTAESWQAQALLGRRLTPRLNASVEARYNDTQGASGGLGSFDSKTKLAMARADYRLGPTVTAGLKYIYMHRTTTLVRYRENVAMLSISKVF